MRLPDLLTGSAFMALGLAVLLGSGGFPAEYGLAGPGLFPSLIGAGLALAGLGIAASGLRQGWTPQALDTPWMRKPRAWAALLVVPGGLTAYALAAPLLGSALVGAAIVAAMAFIWGRRAWEAGLLGAAAALLFHLVFTMLLRVSLPAGPIEALLP
jgi:putative tricarboxylic transport membrane protein